MSKIEDILEGLVGRITNEKNNYNWTSEANKEFERAQQAIIEYFIGLKPDQLKVNVPYRVMELQKAFENGYNKSTKDFIDNIRGQA